MYELVFTKNGREFSELFRSPKSLTQAIATVKRNGYTVTSKRKVSAQ